MMESLPTWPRVLLIVGIGAAVLVAAVVLWPGDGMREVGIDGTASGERVVQDVMSRIVVAVAAVVASVAVATPAGATSCSVPASGAEAEALSAATFDGTPLSWEPSTRMLTMAVSRVHRGSLPAERVELLASEPETAPGGLDMAWDYELGRSYRVHAHSVDVGLATGGCSRNLTTRQAVAEELDSSGGAFGPRLHFGFFAAVLGAGEAVTVSSLRH